MELAHHPPCSLVAELWRRSSTWLSRRHTRAPLAAPIRLMSGHGAQPRSNQGWFLWREENWRTKRKTLEPQERTNKLKSHMMPGSGIELGTIVVRGEHSHHCATRAPLIIIKIFIYFIWEYSLDLGAEMPNSGKGFSLFSTMRFSIWHHGSHVWGQNKRNCLLWEMNFLVM